MSRFLNPQDLLKNLNTSHRHSRSKSRGFSNKIIANYQIAQKLGQGSYAKVYKAIHLPTKQTVAVKVFNKEKMPKQDIECVHKEFEIHKKLFHTNIARVYEFFQNQNKIYIFMEYCQNGQLFHFVNKNGPLHQKFAAKIFKQILSALKYLKSQRIFHRDIKCQNILFDKNWNAKLVDFGFSTKEQQGCFSQTFCGSPSYTAPELAKKLKYKSQMIDIWCLGVTLYAMLMGRLPFDQKQERNTRKNIIEIKYQFKRQISNQAKEALNLIFANMEERAPIEELFQTQFVKNSSQITSHFINTFVDEVEMDYEVIEMLEDQFQDFKSSKIIESVQQFKADKYSALYYLKIQSLLSKGKKVKSDIASPNFQKKQKKPKNIRLRRLSEDYTRKNNDKLLSDKNMFSLIDKKQSQRQKLKLPSIDLQRIRQSRRQNYTPQSPKRILDYVSAYRNYG